MYRPHAAREDTELFPKLWERVARLERAIGIYDLNQLRPVSPRRGVCGTVATHFHCLEFVAPRAV
jgi:hypothetical protein